MEVINIQLSEDEALILFEFFSRFKETSKFKLENNAEFIAFSRISGQLAKSLLEPLKPNYKILVENAINRVGKGYEGLAPGVTPIKK